MSDHNASQPGISQPPVPPEGFPASQPAPSGPGGTPPQAPTSNGLAIAAFVVGLVSLLICLIPVINVVAILGGVVALVLGIVALRKTKSGAGGKGLSIAAVVLSILAILGAIIVNVLVGAALSTVDDAVQDATEEMENQASDLGSDVSEEDQAEAADQALALGQSAEVGEYTVVVKAVNTNANDIIAATNEFNPAPTNQYVLVDLAVVFNGTDEGDPWIDLSVNYVGTDARQYDSSSCSAVIPASAMDVPTLNQTGAGDFSVCMDIPADAINGGSIFVEELISFDDTRSYWATQ